MKKILIIEDDVWISSSLKLYLENSNFVVELYYEWLWAVDKINESTPDLIILDMNLPWKNGDDIIRELRQFSQIPIILLTARSTELDKIYGLELGADDYIAKPFSPRELLARINTIVKRIPNNNEKNITLVHLDIELNIQTKKITKSWKQVFLTSNEFDILKKLLEEKWKIVPREVIMKDIIWYDNYLYDRTIDTHLKNIRKKLGAKDIIKTIRWIGYRID
jgi:two-component system response regulator BaeR